MATIGNLSILVSANTKRFSSGIGRAGRSLKSFVGKIAKTVGKLGALGGALIAVAAGAGLGALIGKSFKTIDVLGKTSDKLGITTEDLGRLQHAAELTGVSSKNMSLGLQRMSRRIAEAAQGAGVAAGALTELGLDAQKLAGMSPDEQFLHLADAFEKVKTQGDRVRLGFKLFDTEGVALINTLKLTRAGLEEVGATADKAGATLSRVETAQIEAANDSITNLRATIGGFVQQLAVKFAPFVQLVADRMNAWAQAGGGVREKVGKAFAFVLRIFAKFGDELAGWKIGIFSVQSLFAKGIRFLTDGFAMLLTIASAVGEFIGIELPGQIKKFTEAFSEELSYSAQQIDKKTEALKEGLGKRSKAIAAFFKDIQDKSRAAAEKVAENAAAAGGLTPALAGPTKAATARQQFSSRFGPGSSTSRPVQIVSPTLVEILAILKKGVVGRVA